MRRSLVVLAPFLVLACTTRSDPNQGRYACQSDAECGPGYECHAQFLGGSLCFKAGSCATTEECNGADDTCDGRTDESFPGQGDSCETARLGVCRAGAKACADGGVVCAALTQPSAELCNGLDDDCDGTVDNGFDLTSDSDHCGTCGHACAAGASCRSSACAETSCGDGLDNDSNGKIDCQDPACLDAVCASTDGGAFRCGAVISPDGGTACTPRTCAGPPASCGLIGDGCGGVLQCPACPPADGGCQPKTCAQSGTACGYASDGCGAVLFCGACDGGCVPVTCSLMPWACGPTGDGCGSVLDCPCADAGVPDAGFVDAGVADAGLVDAGVGDAGALGQRGCFPPEAQCANGVDDDGDGLVDCADPDCASKTCGASKTCSAGTCQ